MKKSVISGKMVGPAKSKIPIKAKVYIHLKDPETGSKTIHIDVESPILNKIIKPGEKTFAAGKEGGFFVGLKKKMIERVKKLTEKGI